MKIGKVEAWKSWPLPGSDFTGDMFDWQNYRCAWCGLEPKMDRLVEDHCHMTGLVRGYLCRRCNIVEGKSWDSAWDRWREGDNPAFAIKEFRIYRSSWGGGTPISSQGALHYYSHAERIAWFELIPGHLEAGAPWPTDAPWIDTAIARRDAARKQMREAMANSPLARALDGLLTKSESPS